MTRILLALIIALPLTTAAIACDSLGDDCEDWPELQQLIDNDHTEDWRAYLTARRAVQKQRLTAYANARVFPINNETYGMANLFLDDEGRPCAMAHLIWQDGDQKLVRKTARTDNALLLGNVTDGALMEWMLVSGLTQDEAAFIQEPDFYIGDLLPSGEHQMLLDAEADRLQSHFLAAAAQLEAYEETSLDNAIKALGNRVYTAPPSLPNA